MKMDEQYDRDLYEAEKSYRRQHLPQFYACGICDFFHPIDWDGDCRDDENRHSILGLERIYGPQDEGWEEVEMPEYGEPKIGKGFFF
jgi:hypothetical protein